MKQYTTEERLRLGEIAYRGGAEALKLSREDFINFGIEYYKTTAEYKQAGENQGWYILADKRILSQWYREFNQNII